MGAAVPSAYFHRDLGIWGFFERRRTARGFSYDPCRILELLVWNRISDPGSKSAAFARKGRFPRRCDFTLDDVYRSLDYLAAGADRLVKHMNASLEAYRGLSRIEESFRVLKSTMDARPVYVWAREHIEAHFLVCYVALLIMRLMQADVEAATGSRPSADAVAEALRNMTGHRLDANVYHFDYRTDLTDALCDAVGIDLSREVMTKGQMRQVMADVRKPRS